MAKFTVSVIATIEASSLVEGRSDAERVIELLTEEFGSLAYCVELREPDLGNTVFEESSESQSATYH